jgi:hypothetical protein
MDKPLSQLKKSKSVRNEVNIAGKIIYAQEKPGRRGNNESPTPHSTNGTL